MRKNQISITINRFNDQVPKSGDEEPKAQQTITVYADSNNVYEALAAAYYEALTVVQKYEELPKDGRREHTDEQNDGFWAKAAKRKSGNTEE